MNPKFFFFRSGIEMQTKNARKLASTYTRNLFFSFFGSILESTWKPESPEYTLWGVIGFTFHVKIQGYV